MQLTSEERELLVALVRRFWQPGVPLRLWLIGSRARGQARRASDIDLFFDSPSPLSLLTRALIVDALEESALAYHVDIVDGSQVNEIIRARMLEGACLLHEEEDGEGLV